MERGDKGKRKPRWSEPGQEHSVPHPASVPAPHQDEGGGMPKLQRSQTLGLIQVGSRLTTCLCPKCEYKVSFPDFKWYLLYI